MIFSKAAEKISDLKLSAGITSRRIDNHRDSRDFARGQVSAYDECLRILAETQLAQEAETWVFERSLMGLAPPHNEDPKTQAMRG